MNKTCARCNKTVYPIEELKCLDKIWHKGCFKCQECNMTLNMRNYKGFNKQPFCEAHIPKAKATCVAETPELKRIQENTKLQSNVMYHAEFEKSKGKFTQVADDPETLRIKANSKIISNVAYHGDLEKKAAMEQKRGLSGENGENSAEIEDGSAYRRDIEASVMPVGKHHHQQQQPPPPPNPVTSSKVAAVGAAAGNHLAGAGEVNNSPYSARTSSTVIYTSSQGPVTNPPPQRRIGSIADFDPVNDYYGSLTSRQIAAGRQMPAPGSSTNFNSHQSPAKPHPAPSSGRVYRAMYDYEAQDSDEVSFVDGDIILNCTSIDEGWMNGLVQRTGRTGMLPANYVEPIN